MTEYPYSQQIHDKILNDWKNVPFDEWKVDYSTVSHPSVNYNLWWFINQVYPLDSDLSKCLSKDHARNLYNQLVNGPEKISEKERTEQAAKEFLGL